MKLPLPPRRKVAGSGDSMLPLINVVFLLMVFFMLVGSMAPRDALEIEPARAQELELADVGSRSLVMAADGRFALGDAVFEGEQLRAQAATWSARHPGETLELKADAALEAQAVIGVLETLRDAGVSRTKLLALNAR